MERSSTVPLDDESGVLDDCTKNELRQQLAVFHNTITEIKSAFASAVQQLATIQHQDINLQEQIQQSKAECQDQIAEVVKLILSLQAEFGSMKCQMQQIQEAQCRFQQQYEGLLVDQDLLLDELRKSASISEQFRHQFKCSRELRSSAGSQSNDSGVALLLERAQAGFSHFGFPAVSDHDSASLVETSHLVTSMVHDYVAGLGHSATSNVYSELEPDALNYDSDSSLVIAANKSLTLSSSLGKQCGLELQHEGSSEEELTSVRRPYASLTDDKRSLSQILKSDPCTARTLSEKGYPLGFKKRNQYLSLTSDRTSIVQDPHYQETRRLQISKTILETERKYCKRLWVLQDAYMEPLKRNGIVSLKDYNTLFPEELFKLYEKHCIVLHKLEERIQAWQWNGIIGDIVLKFISSDESSILHLYTSYVNDFPEVLKTFHKLCRHSEHFTKFLKERIKHPSGVGSDLTELLLIPVQRIPIYIIHLKRMLKYTNFEHPDYENIRSCLNRLRDFLARLNDSMEHSFQLVTARMTPQVDLARNLKSSPFSSKNSKSKFRESNTADSSSDDESIGRERLQLRLKNLVNSSKESLSCDKSCYQKHKDKESLVNAKLCNDDTTSAMAKNFNRGSSTSLTSCDHMKSSPFSNSPKNRLSKQSALIENFDELGDDDVQIDSIKVMSARCCTDSFIFPQGFGELTDDDSIFNDRLSECESVNNNCSKTCYTPASAKVLSFESSGERDDGVMNLNLSSSSTGTLKTKPAHEDKISQMKCEGHMNNNALDKFCKENFSRVNMGRTSSNSSSHHVSNMDLASSTSSQIRPLIKAHSSHAVHQLLKEHTGSHVPVISKMGTSEDLERMKPKLKSEKRRVTLRSIKNMFSRKRGFVNNMRTVDMGTCTSHDDLTSSGWGNASSLSSDAPT